MLSPFLAHPRGPCRGGAGAAFVAFCAEVDSIVPSRALLHSLEERSPSQAKDHVEVSVIEPKTHSGVQATPPEAPTEAPGAGSGHRVPCILPGDETGILPLAPFGRLFGVRKHDASPVTPEDMERAVVEGACDS